MNFAVINRWDPFMIIRTRARRYISRSMCTCDHNIVLQNDMHSFPFSPCRCCITVNWSNHEKSCNSQSHYIFIHLILSNVIALAIFSHVCHECQLIRPLGFYGLADTAWLIRPQETLPLCRYFVVWRFSEKH